jgi:hypothetical protein
MSAWEAGCWSWYLSNVNPFSMESGLVAEMFRDLKLGQLKSLFLSAMNSIHQTFAAIRAEKIKAAQEK